MDILVGMETHNIPTRILGLELYGKRLFLHSIDIPSLEATDVQASLSVRSSLQRLDDRIADGDVVHLQSDHELSKEIYDMLSVRVTVYPSEKTGYLIDAASQEKRGVRTGRALCRYLAQRLGIDISKKAEKRSAQTEALLRFPLYVQELIRRLDVGRKCIDNITEGKNVSQSIEAARNLEALKDLDMHTIRIPTSTKAPTYELPDDGTFLSDYVQDVDLT